MLRHLFNTPGSETKVVQKTRNHFLLYIYSRMTRAIKNWQYFLP